VGAQAKVEGRCDVAEGGDERDEENALHVARRCGHHVHGGSVSWLEG
jgi:hypothetical protein